MKKLTPIQNIAVHVKTQDEYDELMGMIEANPEFRSKKCNMGDLHRENTCVSIAAYWEYCCKEYYEKNGYKTITLSELKAQLSEERSIRDVEVGDAVIDRINYGRMVIAVFKNGFVHSFIDRRDEASALVTFEEAEEMGWYIQGHKPQPKKVTRTEVAKAMDIPKDFVLEDE